MVSALIESKMVAQGIQAVSRLPGVHLAVAGDGPLRDQLRAQADACMPGRYHNFTTLADRMPDLYRSANLFLHLSRDESFGNVFVEAMACGVPTVAWDLQRTRWITGETADLVPDGDSSALTEHVARALEFRKPHEAITGRAEQFSWRAIARQYRDFLGDVTASRNKGD
jgi:glycosyltransferase involved in cell wall biosynthesis